MELRIKNWEKFQHYKTRRPPWIKLYRNILDDPEWHKLSGDASKLLAMLWIVASENAGVLPDLEKLSFRLRIDDAKLRDSLSTLSHWVEGFDSRMLARRKQDATPEKETEREGETEKETEKRIATKGVAPSGKGAPHVLFVEGFKSVYQEVTGSPFKVDQKHWVIAAGLVKAHGSEECVRKAKTLGVLCRDRSAWFTKDGFASFTLETLSNKWNNIIPEAVPLSKDDELLAEIRKREESRVRADAIVANGSGKITYR